MARLGRSGKVVALSAAGLIMAAAAGCASPSSGSSEAIPTATPSFSFAPITPAVPSPTATSPADSFADGSYVVGEDFGIGRYETGSGVTDCYWERTTPSGETQANDLVSFSPNGLSLDLRDTGYGFVSRNCGTWQLVKRFYAQPTSDAELKGLIKAGTADEQACYSERMDIEYVDGLSKKELAEAGRRDRLWAWNTCYNE